MSTNPNYLSLVLEKFEKPISNVSPEKLEKIRMGLTVLAEADIGRQKLENIIGIFPIYTCNMCETRMLGETNYNITPLFALPDFLWSQRFQRRGRKINLDGLVEALNWPNNYSDTYCRPCYMALAEERGKAACANLNPKQLLIFFKLIKIAAPTYTEGSPSWDYHMTMTMAAFMCLPTLTRRHKRLHAIAGAAMAVFNIF